MKYPVIFLYKLRDRKYNSFNSNVQSLAYILFKFFLKLDGITFTLHLVLGG